MLLKFGLIAVSCVFASSMDGDVLLDRPVAKRKTGKEFDKALDAPILASWKNVPLRKILRRISDDREIAILLDRRIDPVQQLPIDVDQPKLITALIEIGRQASADVSTLGSTVYIGPKQSSEKLRTLAEIRTQELQQLSSTLPRGRHFELANRTSFHWNDLDQPTDLIKSIAEKYDLEVTGIEQIPHDLWAGSTLPSSNAVDTLSLILIQFDLTFEWSDKALGIHIVAVPETVVIEKRHRVRREITGQVAREWQNLFPGLQARVEGSFVVVQGTVEQHEAIDAILHPKKQSRTTTSKEPASLDRREFTLRIKKVPLSALMKKLEDSDVVFKYDTQALDDANIDLDRPISMDVEKVSAEEFFKAMFDPVGLTFEVDGLTVQLRPK